MESPAAAGPSWEDRAQARASTQEAVSVELDQLERQTGWGDRRATGRYPPTPAQDCGPGTLASVMRGLLPGDLTPSGRQDPGGAERGLLIPGGRLGLRGRRKGSSRQEGSPGRRAGLCPLCSCPLPWLVLAFCPRTPQGKMTPGTLHKAQYFAPNHVPHSGLWDLEAELHF